MYTKLIRKLALLKRVMSGHCGGSGGPGHCY